MSVDWDEKVLGPCARVFGEDPWDSPVTYYPAGTLSAGFPVRPIFDEAYREIVLLDIAAPTSDAMPVMGINRDQFDDEGEAYPAQDDVLFVEKNSTWYRVKEVRPDGHGNFKLMLNKTAALS